MSLILDALRKSDVERARQQAPQVAGAGAAAAPAPERRWLLPVLALLSVNAALLAWVLLRPSAEPAAATTRAAATTPVVATPPAAAPDESTAATREAPPPAKALVESLSEASAETGLQAAAAAPPPRAAEATTAEPDTVPPRIEPVAASASTPAPIGMPDAMTLVDDGAIAADALSMELHYYADSADRRFAFIGGRKVAGGDSLGNGVRVAEIVRNGVVLEYRGRRYLLRRD